MSTRIRRNFPRNARLMATWLTLALMPSASLTAQQAQAPSSAIPSGGAPNLNISPKRVVFDRATRSASVYVYNQGTAPVTLDVRTVDNAMLESGEIVPVAEAAKRGGDAAQAAGRLQSARPAMIVTPSRIMLAPGKGKTVRLLATPTPPMVQDGGEWRTHLAVTTVPRSDVGLTAEAAANGPDSFSFNVQAIYGISIPLIVRSGPVEANASFEAISLDADAKGGPTLNVPIRRAGNSSVYGNIEVRSGTGPKAPLIGLVRGLGIYREISRRDVKIVLTRAPRAGEKLEVTYTSDDGSAAKLLARGSFVRP